MLRMRLLRPLSLTRRGQYSDWATVFWRTTWSDLPERARERSVASAKRVSVTSYSLGSMVEAVPRELSTVWVLPRKWSWLPSTERE